jgi:hypothetical protein
VAASIAFVAACSNDAAVPVAPRVANPTARDVTCSAQENSVAGDVDSGAASNPDCRATFDDCSDGLHYELSCHGNDCDCIVNGDTQGRFEAEPASACAVDIGQLKMLCGWVSQRR